jgi:hypothetical protein
MNFHGLIPFWHAFFSKFPSNVPELGGLPSSGSPDVLLAQEQARRKSLNRYSRQSTDKSLQSFATPTLGFSGTWTL